MNTRSFFVAVILLLISNTIAAQTASGTKKNKFGFGVGGGLSNVFIQQTDWSTSGSLYADTLNSIDAKMAAKFELILFYQISLQDNIELRPAFSLAFDGSNVKYDRRIGASETLKLRGVPMIFSLPVLFKLPSTGNRFYVSGGPAFLFNVAKDEKTDNKLPLKKFDILADFSAGIDIPMKKVIVTPELKCAIGFSNLYKNNNTIYTNTIEKVRRQSVTVSLLFRDNL